MSSEVDANHYEANNEKVRANCGWITKEFLQDVINAREGNEDVRVVGSEVKAAVGMGDNYLSIMYQMKADLIDRKTGRKETRQFMIKGLPSAKILQHMIEEFGIFRKELYMYNVCLPEMRRIMEEYMPDESDFIAAKSYKCNLPNVVVLEDLKVYGYRMAHRREQLDFDHIVVTVRSLARFHALSVRLVKMIPNVVEELSREEFYGKDRRETMISHIGKALISWLKVMEEQETTKHLVPIMEKVTENMVDKIVHVVGKRNGSFATVNHGDSWTNNFLYKYDPDGRVVHARMVDFQLARYSSPVLDLLYLLFSSSKPDVLAEKLDEIIQVYYEALVSNMTELRLDSSEQPTLEEIRGEMRERSIFGVTAIIVVAPIILAKPSNMADLESFEPNEWEKSEKYLLEDQFRDSFYQEVVVKYLAIMDKMGYLKSAEELVLPGTDD